MIVCAYKNVCLECLLYCLTFIININIKAYFKFGLCIFILYHSDTSWEVSELMSFLYMDLRPQGKVVLLNMASSIFCCCCCFHYVLQISHNNLSFFFFFFQTMVFFKWNTFPVEKLCWVNRSGMALCFSNKWLQKSYFKTI